MKARHTLHVASLALALSFIFHPSAFAQTTAFTYQGRLDTSGAPASGSYDLRFAIYDAASGGTAVAGPLTNSPVGVSNGFFTVTLDFGAGVFTGADRWLEIAVRTNGGGAFTPLSPRQPLTPAPYAIYAAGADAAGLTGALPSGALSGGYFNPVQFTDPGNLFAGTFVGDGSGLIGVNAAQLGGKLPSDFWQLAGNAGTTASDFVGTTDNQALELRVNRARALRLEPRPGAPNLLGGSGVNTTAPGVSGVAIGGGGRAGLPNLALGDFSVIGGGAGNTAALEAVVSGGISNSATGPRAFVGGGVSNAATNGLAVVAGGGLNLAGGMASVVAGGGGKDPNFGTDVPNHALGSWSAVGGGRENVAAGESATVSGGERNEARGRQATASGGVGNQSLGEFSTVGGGAFNTADFPASTVSGGQENAALNQHATVGGGVGNYALGDKATIGGGANNLSTGPFATVPGGRQANPTQHGQLAHAGGMFMNPGDAQHSVFVLRARTDVAVPKASLTLDGAGTPLKIEPNRSLTFDILLVARAEPPLTDSAGYRFQGVVKNAGGIAVFVGPPLATTLGTDVALWSATVQVAGDALVLNVDGGALAGYPGAVRWVARVDAADVSW
jgi:hypothetical protein